MDSLDSNTENKEDKGISTSRRARKRKRGNRSNNDENGIKKPRTSENGIEPEQTTRKMIENGAVTRERNISNPRGHSGSGTAKSNPNKSLSNFKDKARALLETRKKLPIFAHADEIRAHLRRTDVMLLVGETGSGKSTQVPQFLIDEHWCRPKSVKIPSSGNKQTATVGGCIAITQPRRVAAVSLARRVAEEVGCPLGSSSPASKVGYAVRFDTSVSPSTRIKFMTDGMLLQEMLSDPWLTKYSAIVVDEVHERGINVDLLLGFLRNIATGCKEGRGGVPLKIVVMSATADMESLLSFFTDGYMQTSNAQQESIKEDDTSSKTQKANASTPSAKGKEVRTKSDQISVCHIKGRQFPVTTIYSPVPVPDFVDAALKTIFQIHYKEPLPGDILVFLTGQETVENLEYLVNDYASTMDKELPKVLAVPLFAALPQVAQQRVFLPTPPRTRKVILATNIAETSVTVPGVRYVIDCGKAKTKQFRTRLGLDSLLVKPISKSAAIQRKGRAGREAPGQCYRLYPEKEYLALPETNTPEILRCDVSQAILTMKARGVDDIVGFPFLTPPPRDAIEKALLQLFNINALDETGKISPIGSRIAKLPLTAPLGRVLLAGAEKGPHCLRDVIDIISCLSVENIFLNTSSEEKKEQADLARRDLYRREGDHLTMLATVRAYAAENADRRAWAERHLVSHRAMQAVMDVRKQLLAQCKQSKLFGDTPFKDDDSTPLGNEDPVPILTSFLTGFATNTARLFPDGSYRTLVGNQTVAIHPSSVLFDRKIEAIMYNEFVFTTRSYARGVSAVQMNWIGEVLAGPS
ncbi:ATP-dependent RNA helicase [Trichophyton interdigitale]|uniref:RNA helicase n=1 Tax=Trichophyton interdigitale TaxID=101480 RepID=A0A9P4YL65_9EURO|nr:ATP-dependent RNA helicase [Trichophyton interdigitale]KAF3899355.1 ATP-dependent RNA helicase [Trichophyton interdigitale]KAG8210838.1 ATP-dependent RNA helicase [Trichophyton interdigitale]